MQNQFIFNQKGPHCNQNGPNWNENGEIYLARALRALAMKSLENF